MAIATNKEDWTAEQLLAVPADGPELIFPNDACGVAALYKTLIKKWHPDKNPTDPSAAYVFAHIRVLKDAADKKLADGTWQTVGQFSCRLSNGKRFKVRADAKREFDLGTLYISPTTATYVVRKEYAALFKNGLDSIARLRFADAKMRDVYFPHLPTTLKTYETPDAFILAVRKAPDEVLLRDLVPHITENFSKHAAWITSRMQEMVRYLDYVGMAHNAITLDNVFVSARDHRISLLGGWWYAAEVGKPLSFVPGEAIDYLPASDEKTPILASAKLDMEMAKAAAREVLGDRGGTRLGMLKSAPAPVLNYLRTPSSGDPQDDLETWYQKVLPESFGPRHFTELNVSYSDVYPQPRS